MIQVGQVLDKYELLERVGQGGMAIVYRGVDRDLKRVVAVKILHKHLADYKEARDRFQREAQAVAKLRHENILEIFDYSAKDGEESYIVTEFIDGQTLKEFITERPIAFPEVGAMVILQVCRALAHAHAGAILHRDVKPENIMIRSDGVVKLMDFGISHMVDLERLTVTGQLLGSPAYMAPEHVEGRPIDFRTDVFAAGIVLYQLTVGKLPFEGKNPHEVLKRIAECKFVDPRQANPRIGNRLGRIILRAMAANPDDRFAAIGEMVVALDAYLVESGLPADKIPGELARYFQAPASYEEALKARLIDTLTRSGQHKLDDDDRAAALDAFDRVLTIDPANEKVLAILDRINRRARMKTSALAVLGIAAVAGGAYLVHLKSLPPVPVAPIVDITPPQQYPQQLVAHDDPPPKPKLDDVVATDAGVAVATLRDAAIPDAIVAVEPVAVPVDIRVLAGSKYRIGTDPYRPVDGQKLTITVLDHPVKVDITRVSTQDVTLTVDGTAKVVDAHQQFLPAGIVLHCAVPITSVDIDNETASLDAARIVTFEQDAFSSTKTVTVVFYGKRGAPDVQKITVEAGKQQDVKCALH